MLIYIYLSFYLSFYVQFSCIRPFFFLLKTYYSTFLLLQLITDVNLAVSVEATQAIGNLARGLRAQFSGNARMLLPVLLVSLLSVITIIISFYCF